MVEDPPLERRAIRSARKAIIESFTSTARERGSLGIRFMTTYGQQLIRISDANPDVVIGTNYINYNGALIRIREILCDGNYREICVDYYGTVHSDLLVHNPTKLLPTKIIFNTRMRIENIFDLWHPEVSSYTDYDEEPMERIRVESYELPTETSTVFRLSHHDLLIGFYHSEALQLTRWSRRKTILVTEAPTESRNRLHSFDEIVRTTLEEANARHGGGNIPNKIYFDILRRLKRVETVLTSWRSDLF